MHILDIWKLGYGYVGKCSDAEKLYYAVHTKDIRLLEMMGDDKITHELQTFDYACMQNEMIQNPRGNGLRDCTGDAINILLHTVFVGAQLIDKTALNLLCKITDKITPSNIHADEMSEYDLSDAFFELWDVDFEFVDTAHDNEHMGKLRAVVLELLKRSKDEDRDYVITHDTLSKEPYPYSLRPSVVNDYVVELIKKLPSYDYHPERSDRDITTELPGLYGVDDSTRDALEEIQEQIDKDTRDYYANYDKWDNESELEILRTYCQKEVPLDVDLFDCTGLTEIE
ncbi:MAG: hypothetical protein LBL41_03935 [Bifidobacteriaceae bacterium]|jgi:hypothetical protein|nr:hypothetical protein [Bifidobacteriaceae bacterium]